MKILYFFLFLWVIFALLDPDKTTQINADPDPDMDPDPKPCWLPLLTSVEQQPTSLLMNVGCLASLANFSGATTNLPSDEGGLSGFPNFSGATTSLLMKVGCLALPNFSGPTTSF
jgi:hypothetical protein